MEEIFELVKETDFNGLRQVLKNVDKELITCVLYIEGFDKWIAEEICSKSAFG